MITGTKMRVKLASAGLAVALGLGGCALMAPTGERYVAPPVGSTWVIARRDTGSYGSASVQLPNKFLGEQMWQGQKVIAFEGPEQTTLLYPIGGFVAQVKGSTTLVSWHPPQNFDWPLVVGKTWTKSQSVTIHAAKRTIPYEFTTKVEAYEDVTVPAGTFKAFRVSTVNTIGDENVQWFSPQHGIFVKSNLRRTAKHAQGPGTREIELVSQKITR